MGAALWNRTEGNERILYAGRRSGDIFTAGGG